MQANTKDLVAGAIFIVTGLAFSINSLLWLKIGRAFRMGEGYFPLVLGLVLVGFGLLVAFNALRQRGDGWGAVSWRGVVLVTAAIVYFGLAIRTLGLVPALAGTIVLAGFATRDTSPLVVFGLAIGLTAFCVGVFSFALGMPLDLVGPWLRGG